MPIKVSTAVLFLIITLPWGQGTRQWESGFETGFPGDEWLSYDNGTWSQDGSSTGTATWTIVGEEEGIPIPEGNYIYKGWISGPASESHRCYPVIHCDIPSPLVNTFYVWLDAEPNSWVHVATWGANEQWAVHTMSVIPNGRLEMAHLDWEYVGPAPQPPYPMKQWVKFTAYIDYSSDVMHVWQDGVHMFSGSGGNMSNGGDNLMRAHWGMYAGAAQDNGVQYNDVIRIWSLDAPLTDFSEEPPSPYAASVRRTDITVGKDKQFHAASMLRECPGVAIISDYHPGRAWSLIGRTLIDNSHE